MEARQFRARLRVITLILVLIIGVFAAVLHNLQIVHGADYREKSVRNITQTETVEAARGQILDRYGRVLVSNKTVYQVTLDTSLMGEESKRNPILLSLLDICREEGVEWTDEVLPISMTEPFTYTDTLTEAGQARYEAFLEQMKWTEAAEQGPDILLAKMREFYKVDNSVSPEDGRALVGVLCELRMRSLDIVRTSYVFAQDVDIDFISRVKEEGLVGVTIEPTTVRQYNTTYAAHLLGRVASMGPDDWEYYKNIDGYSMDDTVGKDGVELAFESYLHGTSGTRLLETDENGAVVSQQWQTEPQPGNHVVLTLDSQLQAHTEQLLGDFVSGLSDPAGAAAVMVDMSGGVLALASYPTYDLSTYSEDYNDLLTDPAKPLLNRATQGVYPPGSIFKMVTAVGGLSEGLITPSSTTYCSGIYTYYPDYQPVCWIRTSTGGSHGSETVSEAIKDSCNIFFYDLGRRLGIDKLVDYATAFGLGQYTGIELPESKGTVAGPETTEKLGGTWYAGQTLSAAIGQDNNMFTPIQLANYVATLVNGGNRYETHLLKEVKSSDYSQVVYEYEPKLASTIDIDPEDLAAVKQGMYDLSQTASMARYFDDLPVSVGCKTGTAEVSGSDATATFVCFAPYDDPQVALCLVAEKGSAGGNLAALAASMLEEYFSNEDNLSVTDQENTLLH